MSGQFFTDQQLVDGIISGDKKAVVTLIRQTENLVAKIICNLVAAQEDRRDIVQDTYLKVFHKIHTFTFQSKLSTWIGQIAYHTAINWMRKKQPHYPGNLEEMEEVSNSPSPERMIVHKELMQVLQQHIQTLPQVQQLLISLFHQQELSYAEIRTITGMPEGTIKNYLFRARKELKRQLLLTHSKEAL
ncbi:MAG: sigma-70 family RNA polymerase sigma factor [Chitinophagaceae bacterium]|nr:sigma-70 family RNA polymerase sigma factor [Chitinophagaceae bacterium]